MIPPIQILDEAALGDIGRQPVGTIAELRRPDGIVWRYVSCGAPGADIAMRLGWGERTVWLREPERTLILNDHPGLFPSLEHAIEFVLQRADFIHVNLRGIGQFYFIIAAETL